MNVKETLELAVSCGLTVERGTRHYKLLTSDGRVAAVIPYRVKRNAGKQGKNAEAAIRRAGRASGA